MVNRQRFLLDDLDSEGFPVPKPRDPLPLLALNIGRLADHGMVQALLADHKCVQCEPRALTAEEQAFIDAHEDLHRSMAGQREKGDALRSLTLVTDLGEVDVTDAARNLNYTDPRLNPKGWGEVDGVKLPHITWADENPHTTDVATKKALAEHFLGSQPDMSEFATLADGSPVPAAADYTRIEERIMAHQAEVDVARAIVQEADAHMDGITRLSDSYAPDAYYGWKR